MVDVYDFMLNPNKEEINALLEDEKEIFEKIKISTKKEPHSITDMFCHTPLFEQLVTSFNHRIFDLQVNYVLLKKYYDVGIPDDPWYISPGPDGATVQYFPHFKEHDFANIYWFHFYVESFYSRYEGIVDSVYHILDGYYKLNIPTNPGFRRQILDALKNRNNTLYQYLESFKTEPIYVELKQLRNDFIHNQKPSDISSGVSFVKNADGSETYSMGIGNYTPSEKFLSNIKSSLKLLENLSNEVETAI